MRSSPEPLGVLVVDDDDQMSRTIGDILTLHGYVPTAVSSGRHGLEVVQSASAVPAIALVDLRLPDMDGIELVAELRAISDAIEIVVLTGNASVDSAVRALREQSYDYLIKPVQPDRLLQSIERAGERWQRRRAEAAMRESEERLRRIFEHVSDALFITDDTGRIIDANPAASELTARAPHALLGSRLSDVLYGAPSDPVDGSSARDVPASGELRIRGPDGSVRIVDTRAAVFAPGLVVHTVRDLTPQRRLEEELHHSQKMDAIGRLAGGVAHDLNNILTSIGCASELVLASLEPLDARRAEIEEITKGARRAASLTRQLLAFSRKQVLQPRVIDLVHVIGDVERMLRRLIGEDIELTVQMPPQLWPVRADPSQLEQVVMNLAVNARDAMPDGGKLTIEADNVRVMTPRRHEHGVVEPGEYVVLRVSDTGCGMDQALRTQIFEPFFTTKPPGKGTGLGLSTVYGIIAQSGGHVVVESDVGAGATFLIYVPRCDVQVGTAAAETPVPTRQRTATILIVEDDAGIRALACRILSASGHVVLEAANSEQAFRIAEEHASSIDLLVTDVVLSGMNGRELADRLRSDQQALNVLYMSGYTDDEIVHRGVRDLRHSFLSKPFTPDELRRKIQEVLERPAMAQQDS
ncbi:MAG TPA: response regulator [Gemmatimonadaceae bacterium]|nr:response regulator [Gemmatimonadaceae bacterium]